MARPEQVKQPAQLLFAVSCSADKSATKTVFWSWTHPTSVASTSFEPVLVTLFVLLIEFRSRTLLRRWCARRPARSVHRRLRSSFWTRPTQWPVLLKWLFVGSWKLKAEPLVSSSFATTCLESSPRWLLVASSSVSNRSLLTFNWKGTFLYTTTQHPFNFQTPIHLWRREVERQWECVVEIGRVVRRRFAQVDHPPSVVEFGMQIDQHHASCRVMRTDRRLGRCNVHHRLSEAKASLDGTRSQGVCLRWLLGCPVFCASSPHTSSATPTWMGWRRRKFCNTLP